MSASLDRANTFLADPESLFHRGADGLPRISFAVMQLAANGPASGLSALKPIFAKANSKQQAAIAKGLVKAYEACQITNYSTAAAIRDSVGAMGDRALLAAFQRAKAELEDPVAEPASVDVRSPSPGAAGDRLDALMPGYQLTGSLDLADPAKIPGE